jgi:hypothetical protein
MVLSRCQFPDVVCNVPRVREKAIMRICKEVPCESDVTVSTLAHVAKFLRGYWLRSLVISGVVVTPCLWHAYIVNGDSCSHIYNAWVAHLIKIGQAPGLWLASQWNNVLFDLVLSGLGNIAGWEAAQKIATCGAVLIFFWGAFTLVWAMTRHFPWFYVPCLAIVAYGWTFEIGLMNYYISIGLAFFGLAILTRGKGWERGWVAALVPLIWLAHPLGLALLVVVGAYIVLAEHLPPRRRVYLFAISGLLLVAIHFFIAVRCPHGVIWSLEPRVFHDGIDQLLLFGPHYLLPARLFLAFICICLLLDLVKCCHAPRWWSAYLLPSELYSLALLGAMLLPTAINHWRLQQMGFSGNAFLTERLTSVSAVFLCCLLGAMKPQKWHFAGFGVIAVIFFFFLYRDTATLNSMEDEVRRCVHTVAPGQRVVGTIHNFSGSRVSVHGIVDRACIGHCFDYGNYEPASQQFRVRAHPGNPFVLTDWGNCQATATGKYVVLPADLPLYEVEQCGSNLTAMCIRELVAGETNGRIPWGSTLGEAHNDEVLKKQPTTSLYP